MTTPRPTAVIASEIRQALTAALLGQALPESIACRLPADIVAAATPGAAGLLTGRKSVIDALISAIIDAPAA